ncbi:MAG TPA: hypothetical protein VFW96_00980 [Thermomicrobiales bacterium]|nr:hypothetical protein [Thermomicrobiales bacterium]
MARLLSSSASSRGRENIGQWPVGSSMNCQPGVASSLNSAGLAAIISRTSATVMLHQIAVFGNAARAGVVSRTGCVAVPKGWSTARSRIRRRSASPSPRSSFPWSNSSQGGSGSRQPSPCAATRRSCACLASGGLKSIWATPSGSGPVST